MKKMIKMPVVIGLVSFVFIGCGGTDSASIVQVPAGATTTVSITNTGSGDVEFTDLDSKDSNVTVNIVETVSNTETTGTLPSGESGSSESYNSQCMLSEGSQAKAKDLYCDASMTTSECDSAICANVY